MPSPEKQSPKYMQEAEEIIYTLMKESATNELTPPRYSESLDEQVNKIRLSDSLPMITATTIGFTFVGLSVASYLDKRYLVHTLILGTIAGVVFGIARHFDLKKTNR